MRTIAHISDLHFGRHNLHAMEDLVKSIEAIGSDLVVISGDFTQRARHAEFAEARLFLDRISFPKLVTPGNHDVPLYNLFSRAFRPFRKFDRYIAPLNQPLNFYSDDELAVLALNTARRFTRKNGRLSHFQIAEIRRIFGPLPRKRTKVIVTHHPLAIPSGQDPLELAGRASDANKAIADAGIHLLLSGHHHRALSGPIAEVGGGGSVLIVHAGTAISTRIREEAGNSYNVIEVDHQDISVRVMAWVKGRGFVAADAVNYVVDAGRWRGSTVAR
jgi:3',5'-cyclic AMP phosphodiesterase CpdA